MIFRKIIKKFIKDERGSDILIKLLMLAFALVLLGLMLVWATDLLLQTKENTKSLFDFESMLINPEILMPEIVMKKTSCLLVTNLIAIPILY